MIKMKDSGIPWIGQIPEDWEVCKIKFLCSVIFSGGTPSTNNDKYWNGDIPWLQSGKIQNDYIFEYDKTITKEGLENSSTKMVMKDSILLAMTGATCSNVGYLTFNSCANQSVMAYIPLKNTNPKFLFYILIACKNEILLHKNGGAQSGINGEVCQNLYAPKLPLKIQQKIVEILDKKCGQIDELVRIEENEIEKLKEYKTSLITKVVTKGLDPNAKMKDSGIPWIGQIPEDWKIGRLKFYAQIKTGSTPPTNIKQYFDENINWFTPSDFKNMYLNNSERKIASSFLTDFNITLFPLKTTLLVGIGATCGKIALINNEGYCNQQITAIVASNNIDRKFMFYEMSAIQKYLKENALYTTLPILNNEYIKNINIIIADIEIQQQIVDYLDKRCEEIDNLIKIKQEKIEKLKEYKKSLIYQYVTGKKEVV